MNAIDFGALGLLLVLAAWGAWRGPLRPLLGLVLLAVALFAASRLAGPLADTASRVSGLDSAEAEAAAWGAVLFGALVLGSVLLAFAGPWIRAAPVRGGAARLLGALIGTVQGAAWAAVAVYLVLAFSGDGPSLSHGTDRPGPDWRADAPASQTVEGLGLAGDALRRSIGVPDWIAARMEAVERELGTE